jgi:protein phosphatase
MGTTCSVLVLLPHGAIAAHVGDSRIYRWRANTINQLTFDHSLQWELRASGQMPEGSDIAAVVPKNVITRSLGPNANVQIDLEGPHPHALGDVYLLCSDGLTGRVEDQEIGAIVACLPPQEAAQALIDLANLRGGPDNITVLIGKIVGPEMLGSGGALEPLRMGSAPHIRPINVMIWIAALVCLLASGIMAAIRHIMGAEIALGCAAVVALAALIHRYAFVRGKALGGARMLGRGPYTEAFCEPNHELSQKLKATLDELRDAARDGDWTINLQALDDSFRSAQAADEAGQFADAVRHYCRAISSVMNELRSQTAKKASDSTVRY